MKLDILILAGNNNIVRYLTIIPQARVEYEMVDSQLDA